MVKTEPIIEYSLLEEREQLHRILAEQNQDPLQLEDRLITWANDLIMGTLQYETGQIQLVPHRDQDGDQVKEDPPADPQGEHQSLGGRI